MVNDEEVTYFCVVFYWTKGGRIFWGLGVWEGYGRRDGVCGDLMKVLIAGL